MTAILVTNKLPEKDILTKQPTVYITQELKVQLDHLLRLTHGQKIKWEKNTNSRACSCDLKGRLMIISSYIESNHLFIVLYGFDGGVRPIRIEESSPDFSTVEAFYRVIRENAVTIAV